MEQARQFIIQEFAKRRERNPNFSLRAFAKWLGISPAQLSQMMAGKRTVTLDTIKTIAERVGASPLEKKALMTSLLKDKKLIETKATRQVLHLEEDQFRLISDWYHFAILSLAEIKGAKSDPRWVARRLGISVEEAHQALLRLERMGVLQTKPVFKQICSPLEVVSDVPSQAIRKFHNQNLNLAAEKIESIPNTLRQFQSITVPMNTVLISKFKKMIDEFLDNATELAQESSPTEVYQINVQLFPVTKIQEDGK